MKITPFLNKTATYEARQGEDGWGKHQFAAPKQIRVRITTKYKLLKTKTGHEFINVTEYMTEQPLKLGDRIDSNELQAVESIEDLKNTIGWLGYPTPPTGYASSS